MSARNVPQSRDPESGRYMGSWIVRDRTVLWLDPARPDPDGDPEATLVEVGWEGAARLVQAALGRLERWADRVYDRLTGQRG